MGINYRKQGSEDALLRLNLEKVAVVAPLAKKLVGGAASRLAAGRSAMSNLGTKAEKGIADTARNYFGEGASKATAEAVKGVPGRAMQGARGGAMFGGAIEGLGEAASAAEGEGLSAFARGAGRGALSWGALGGIGAGASGVFKNTASKKIHENIAKKHMLKNRASIKDPVAALSPTAASKNLAKKQMDTGFGRNLKDMATGKGPMGRGASAARAGTGIAEGVVDTAPWLLAPAAMVGGGGEPQSSDQQPQSQRPQYQQYPQQYPQYYGGYYGHSPYKTANDQIIEYGEPNPTINAPQNYPIPPGYAGAMVGGVPSGIASGYLSRALESAGKLPKTRAGALAATAIPTLGSTLGGATGFVAANKMFPEKKPEEIQKLEQIDFDKLMRYYKRKDLEPTPQE